MNIDVQRISPDGLSKQEWSFYADTGAGISVRLSRYLEAERATKRHGWSVKVKWGRINRRDSTITIEEIPLPNDVQYEVKTVISNSITITK